MTLNRLPSFTPVPVISREEMPNVVAEILEDSPDSRIAQIITALLFDPEMATKIALKTQSKRVAVGDKFPHVLLNKPSENGFASFWTTDFLAGKKVLVFSTPQAFTKTCSGAHLPSISQKMDAFLTLVDAVVCLVPTAMEIAEGWRKNVAADARIVFFADVHQQVIRSLGIGRDGSANHRGLGFVAERTAMIVHDGVVKAFFHDTNAGECTVTSGDSLLAFLQNEKSA